MLLEALIAVLIFSMGILAVAGLQTVMLKNTSDANYRAQASHVVQSRLSQILTNPMATHTATNETVASLPGGELTITEPTVGRLNFVVTWQAPGQDEHSYTANASVNFNFTQ